MATVLAHQGGWDEAAFIMVPMVILAVLLWLARRRAEREMDDDHGDDSTGEADPGSKGRR
jgi:hypothetical protein